MSSVNSEVEVGKNKPNPIALWSVVSPVM